MAGTTRQRTFPDSFKSFHAFVSRQTTVPCSMHTLFSQTNQDSAPTNIPTKSSLLRRQFTFLRNELPLAFSHTAAGFVILFLVIFFLGAQSSFHERDFNGLHHSQVHASDLLRPLIQPQQSQLHDYHSVPNKYLHLMTNPQQRDLLQRLSSPVPNTHLSPSYRHAVFTYISDCRLHSCLRAIASAIAYAHVTARVAVIFIEHSGRMHTSQVFAVCSHPALRRHAVFVSLDKPVLNFHQRPPSLHVDWAEFTVAHAVAPRSVSVNVTTFDASLADKAQSSLPMMNSDEDGFAGVQYLPKIGNTKEVATLDSLAALDTHVSLSLNEVVWSRYSPRIVQEELFERAVLASTDRWRKVLETASLLGRRRQTRNVALTEQRLHRIFKIPHMFLRGMRSLEKKLLLLKLERKVQRRRSSPRVMFVHTQYGLGNRLRALGSAMAFARRTDRVLVVIWVPDQHLNCRYTDLFVASDEFVVSDSFRPGEEWPFSNNFVSDANMKHVKWYNFMRVHGMKVNSSTDLVADDKEHHIYVSTCYVIQSPVTPFIIRTTSSFWQVLRSLTPHIDVVRLVERFASYPLSQMIGIHIRGKSIKVDISGVSATDYTEESSRTTDYWRNLTQVDTFIEEMRKQPADQLFYVAADSKDVFNRLEREFPSRVFYTSRKCDSRDRECLPFALADILLLARCSSLRGSYWSSFSELSTRIGGARYLLAGIDFGRPET